MLRQRDALDGRLPGLLKRAHPGGGAERVRQDAATSEIEQVGGAGEAIGVGSLATPLPRADHRQRGIMRTKQNAILRMAQYRAHQDMSMRCELARRFVIGKLSNQRQRLQRFNRTHRDVETSKAIGQITDLLGNLTTLPVDQHIRTKPLMTGDHRVAGTALETILGMEGAGSAAYFSCFGKLLSDPRQWPFPGRVKRPPTDPLNSLLSFGYSLLTNKVASALQMVGFDHYVGYLHSSVYGRPALALDLMEELRPVIVDSVVLTLLNNRMFTPNDFVVELGAYRLTDQRRKVFFTKFEERLDEEVTHPTFGYKATYRRCIELQSRLLAKYLTGELEEYPPFIVHT